MSPHPHSRNTLLTDFLVSTAAFLFIYASLMFRFGTYGDEIWDIVRGDPTFYIGAGRWGLTLFRAMTSDIVTPVAYGIVAGVCMGLAIAMQIRHFRFRNESPTCESSGDCLPYLFIAINLGIIQFAHQMTYAFQADATSAGYLLATVGYLAYRRGFTENRIGLFLASILCFLLATSTYQTIILIPALLFVTDTLSTILRNDKRPAPPLLLRDCLTFFVVILISFILYQACTALTMPLAKPEDIAACKNYQQSLLTWGGAPAWILALHAAKLMCIHLIGAGYTGEWFYATTIIPVILLLIHLWKKKRTTTDKLVATLCIGALWVFPFLPIMAIGRDMGARLFCAEPMSCALLWCFCLTSKMRILRRVPAWLIYALATILVVKAAYMVSDMAHRQKLMYDKTMLLTEEIQQRAWHTPVPDGVDVYSCPIVVLGGQHPDWPEDRYESAVIGYHPDGGFFHKQLFQYSVHPNMKGYSKLSKERLREELDTMSTYPAAGSCRYVDGEILVKFGIPLELR